MADPEDKKPDRGLALPAGVGAGGGIAVGALGGAILSKLSTDPTKAADWVLEHGLSGTFFVVVVCLVFVVWRMAERIDTLQDKINGQDRRYAEKVEQLMDRLVQQSAVIIRLVTKTEAALSKLHLMPDHEDTDEDGAADDEPGATGEVPTTGRKR